MSLSLSDFKRWFERHQTEIHRDFFKFLRFKSVSADPVYANELQACANWLITYLKEIGLKVEKWEGPGHPVVFAQNTFKPNCPTLLIYHHYDVQPVDPLNLWQSDPFEPTIREGKVYARGAQDNKGQCFFTLTALKAFFSFQSNPNLNLKLIIEGEEESGGECTTTILKQKADLLKADYLIIADNNLPHPNVPGLTLGLRGIITAEVVIQNSKDDLHSGCLGGIAYNPIRALVEAIASLRDSEGRIIIPHFYDDVEPLSKEMRAQLGMDFDEKLLTDLGIKALGPEPGFSVVESNWTRPTLEINGINGGYSGEGFKTVLPAKALAKISCRLVPHQNPEKIFKSLKEAILKKIPKGMECEVRYIHGCPAFRSSLDSLIAKTATKAYEEVLGKPSQHMLNGGSIPIVTDLAKVSGAQVVLFGYGLDTDNIHAPNEHFGLDRFEQGFLTVGRILALLAGEK